MGQHTKPGAGSKSKPDELVLQERREREASIAALQIEYDNSLLAFKEKKESLTVKLFDSTIGTLKTEVEGYEQKIDAIVSKMNLEIEAYKDKIHDVVMKMKLAKLKVTNQVDGLMIDEKQANLDVKAELRRQTIVNYTINGYFKNRAVRKDYSREWIKRNAVKAIDESTPT